MAFNVIRTGRLTRPIPEPSDRTLIGLLGVVALSAVDGTIVSTAMPQVVGQIGGLDLYAWVFASFMLANTAATPVFGRFADRNGVRPTMAWALIIFLIGSALAGVEGWQGRLALSSGASALPAGPGRILRNTPESGGSAG